MFWACISLPSLALDSVLRGRASIEQPFALVHGTAQQRSVLAVNRQARAQGIMPGQRLAAAEALCRDLVIEQCDPRAVKRSLSLLAAWAYRYSSQVSVAYPMAIVLEVEKSLRLFGPWPALEVKLRHDLMTLGFRHRIALAPTPRAAWVLAGVHDGLAVMTPRLLQRALERVPVTCARLPDDIAHALPAMGIRDLRKVFALPRDALKRRFGASFLDTLDELIGTRPSVLSYYQPPDTFDARIELPCEVTNHQALLFPLRRMLGDLAAYLCSRDGGVSRFTLRFEHEHHAITNLAVGLLAPERDETALFEVAKLHLEQIQLSAPVWALGLHARELPPFVPAGRQLFDERPANAVPWEQLRERLRARLGEDAVFGLRADPDPRPERSSIIDDDSALGDEVSLPQRPTWLLVRPIPLRGPAPRVLAGPERLETGWWDGGDIRRDYYIVETATGQHAWAFCPPGERQGWILHGWFA